MVHEDRSAATAPVLNLDGSGISAGVLERLLDQIREQKIGLHTLALRRHGQTVMKMAWDPYRPEEPHMLFSLSKSFASVAIGFAVQEGILTVDDKVTSFFEDLLPTDPCGNMREMTIKHLLTMNTGHEQEIDMFHPDQSIEERFMQSYIPHKPGTRFLYNTPATYMLSAILTRKTGETLTQFLRPRLFGPLGFRPDVYWDHTTDNIDFGGFGLNLNIEEIARFGEFLLRKGTWNGKQLLDPQWIEDASHPWSDNAATGGGGDWGAGYGYQFWMCKPDGVYRGDGAFGQLCIVCPEQDLVIAATASTDDMQAQLQLFWDHLLPFLDKEDTFGDEETLRPKMTYPDLNRPDIEIPSQTGFPAPGEYLMSEMFPNCTKITLPHPDAADTDGTMKLILTFRQGGTMNLELAEDRWIEGQVPQPAAGDAPNALRESLNRHFTHYRAKRVPTDDHALAFDLLYPATTQVERWIITKQGADGLQLTIHQTGSMGIPQERQALGVRA